MPETGLKSLRRRLATLILLTGAIWAAGTATGAHAQTYPNKPIRMIVPYAPGGSTDQFARALAEQMSKALGANVIVENKPGGNAIIGAEAAAHAAPDGYTVFLGSSASLAVNQLLYSKLPYDPVRDFAGVTMLYTSPLVMVINPSVPANSVKEFVAWAKTKSPPPAYASVGNGNPLHLTGELFKQVADVDMTHVPYNGSAPALTGLMGDQTQVMFDVILSSQPHIKAGKLRALGVTSKKRSVTLPDVPTIAESGYPGFDAFIWFAMMVPKGTPPAIIAKLNSETNKVLNQPEMISRFETMGFDLVPSTPEEVGRFMSQEQAKYSTIIKDRNIRLD